MGGRGRELFSAQARDYARFRPGYPDELFRFLAELAVARLLAWDCGTGSGQAAVGLAEHFDRVVATDISEEQLSNARAHPKVEYLVCPAERTELENQSVDLVVAAQALHWFDINGFYREVRRISKPRAVVAVWCYGLPCVTPEIDALVIAFYSEVLGPYWAPERRHVDEKYGTIPFPFSKITAPGFVMKASWGADDFLGYIGSWSAVRSYISRNQSDPLDGIGGELRETWGESGEKRLVTWPVHLRVGCLGQGPS